MTSPKYFTRYSIYKVVDKNNHYIKLEYHLLVYINFIQRPC